MNKFVLKKEKDNDNHYDVSDITVEFEAELLPVILDEMRLFLKGCGFHLDDILYTVSENGEPISAANCSMERGM